MVQLSSFYINHTGYSPSGNVTGELVYVNYASMDDFATLASLGVNVTGKIGIARYGELFRGTKAMIAQNYGMIGLLIYSGVLVRLVRLI